MKKLISVALALALVFSLSVIAFADTTSVTDNTTADIPVSVRQEFIDDIDEGYYLADIRRSDISEEVFKIEGLYLPLVQTASDNVSSYTNLNLYYSGLEVKIARYRLDATFAVNYDGIAPQCVSFSHSREYEYSAPGGYTFDFISEQRTIAAGNVRLTVTFRPYWNGSPVGDSTYSDYAGIRCDSYGNFTYY